MFDSRVVRMIRAMDPHLLNIEGRNSLNDISGPRSATSDDTQDMTFWDKLFSRARAPLFDWSIFLPQPLCCCIGVIIRFGINYFHGQVHHYLVGVFSCRSLYDAALV